VQATPAKLKKILATTGSDATPEKMAALRNLMGDFEEVGDVKDAEIVPTGEQKILEIREKIRCVDLVLATGNFTVEEEKKARGECKPGEGIDKAREWAKVMRRMVAACLKLQITAPSLVLKIREVCLNEKHALRRLEGESETGWGMKVQEDFRYSEWVCGLWLGDGTTDIDLKVISNAHFKIFLAGVSPEAYSGWRFFNREMDNVMDRVLDKCREDESVRFDDQIPSRELTVMLGKREKEAKEREVPVKKTRKHGNFSETTEESTFRAEDDEEETEKKKTKKLKETKGDALFDVNAVYAAEIQQGLEMLRKQRDAFHKESEMQRERIDRDRQNAMEERQRAMDERQRLERDRQDVFALIETKANDRQEPRQSTRYSGRYNGQGSEQLRREPRFVRNQGTQRPQQVPQRNQYSTQRQQQPEMQRAQQEQSVQQGGVCTFPVCRNSKCVKDHLPGAHQPLAPGECWNDPCNKTNCKFNHSNRNAKPQEFPRMAGAMIHPQRVAAITSTTKNPILAVVAKRANCQRNHDGMPCEAATCPNTHGLSCEEATEVCGARRRGEPCRYFFDSSQGCRYKHRIQ